MNHTNKTKAQLIAELEEAQREIAILKMSADSVKFSVDMPVEKALKVSEENYRNLIENSESAVAVLNRDGQILYANPYGIRIWNDPQVIGKTIFDIYPPEYAARYSASIKHVIDTQTSILDEVKSLINGKSRWFRLSMIPLKNPDGTVTTLLLNAWDLTERKQSEEALLASESRAQAMLSAIPDLVFRMDREGIFLDVRAEPQDLYYQQDTIIGKRYRDIMPYEFSRLIDQKIEETLRTGQLQTFEFELPLPGRGMRRYEARMTSSGRDEVIAIVRDITESKKAAETIKKNEHNLRLFVEHSPAAIAMFDTEMRYIIASRRYLQDYDLGEQDLTGRSHYEVFPEIPERWKEIHRRCLQGAIEKADEDPFPRADGHLDWAHWEIHPWYQTFREGDDKQEIGGIILFSEVITQRKEAEANLRESEERFRSMFENSKATMLVIDPNSGQVLDANPAAVAFYGFSHQQITGMKIEEINILPPERVFAERQKAKTEQRSYFVFPHRLASGEIRTVEVYSHPIKTKEQVLLYSIIFDITERKRAEAMVYAQRDLARAIGKVTSNTEAWKICIDTALQVSELDSGGIYLFDSDSSALELIYHRGLGDAFIQTVLRFTNDAQNVKMVRSGQVFQFGSAEMEHNPVYSTEGLRSIIVVPIQYQGQVMGCLNMASHTLDVIPVQARHALEAIAAEIGNFILYMRSETALRTSEENFRLIADTIDEVFWMSDPDISTMLYISPGYEQVWGRTQKSLYENPTSFIEAIIPEERERVVAALLVQKDGLPFSQEYHIQHTDGSIRTIWDRGYPVPDQDGKVTRYVGIAQDITKRKQIEAEKQFLFDTLNERAQDLTLLLDAGHELSETLDLKQIYEISYRYIKAAVPCSILIISSFEAESELITCEYLQNEEGIQNISDFPPIPLEPAGQGTQSRVIRSGEPLLLPDYVSALKTARTSYIFDENAQIIEEEDSREEDDLPRSAIIVPLKANGVTVGALQILSHSLNAHTKDHLRFVEAFAFRVSAALSNARLFAELEKRVQERTAEIESTRRRLELATQAAKLGIWDWNIKTGKLIGDRQMASIYGMDVDRLNGLPEELLGIVHQEDKEKVATQIQEKVHGKANDDSLEYRVVHHSGVVKRVENHTIVINNAEGEPEHLIGVARDITLEKMAEDALRESEERYRKAISAANAVPYSLDYKENQYTFIGEGIERITGYTHEEMTPTIFDSIIQETGMRGDLETLPTFEATKRVRAGQVPGNLVWRSDFRIRNKAGESRWLSDISVQVLDEQEKPLGSIGILQDITERKEAEETLRRANIEMERALRVKDEFLASMSHELRTPLTGILGLSEALQYDTYGKLNDKQKNILANIEKSGHHLLDLINDILDISKMEAGKLDLDIELCSLNDICQSSLQLIKGMAQKKEQSISFSMEPGNIAVMADQRRLKQILVNLLSNAVKYSPPRSPISLEVLLNTQTQTVNISVKDKGIGITKEDLAKLFQPFVQLDSSLSRQQSGTGLGLALVKRLVELHGGNLHVESTPGAGSCFTVSMVYTPSPIKQIDKIIPIIEQKVLVVEGSTVDSERIIRYLKILGAKPIKCSDSLNIVKQTLRAQPDLILLDIHPSDPASWEALTELKTNDETRMIPVFVIAAEKDGELAAQLGAEGYLVKPFTLLDMNMTLSQIQQTARESKEIMNNEPAPILANLMLVEDNEINTFMLEDFLKTKNFNVFSTTTGLEFLAQVEAVKPDLVLMDIQMPEIDGLETIRRLRILPDPWIASVPVIAMTALAMPGDRERCLEAGANDYVSKPIRLSELSDLILKTIQRVRPK